MNKTGDLEEHTDYACHCLNVRIKAFPTDRTPPPELAPDSQYSPVYVRDESIIIVSWHKSPEYFCGDVSTFFNRLTLR